MRPFIKASRQVSKLHQEVCLYSKFVEVSFIIIIHNNIKKLYRHNKTSVIKLVYGTKSVCYKYDDALCPACIKKRNKNYHYHNYKNKCIFIIFIVIVLITHSCTGIFLKMKKRLDKQQTKHKSNKKS